MSTSASAILFWGFPIDPEGALHARIEHELGPGGEWDSVGDCRVPVEGSLAWLEWTGDVEFGCVVHRSQSSDHGPFFIAVKDSMRWCRGRPVSVETGALDSHVGDRIRKLMAFTERFNVPWKEPGWWLAYHVG